MPKNFMVVCIVITMLTLFGSILIYTSSSLVKSRSSLDNMVNQQAVERKLQEQNERYYNDLYERYETAIRNLDDYQTDTNNQVEHLRERLERIEGHLDRNSNNITINNDNSSNINN